MATASATVSPAMAASSHIVSNGSSSGKQRRSRNKVHYITGLNSFGGLKANNNSVVSSLGFPVSFENSFAKIMSCLKNPSKGGNGGSGGMGMGSTCNAAVEIFRIAAIMNGLVLVGVAVGFVLLRIEAYVEETEAEAD